MRNVIQGLILIVVVVMAGNLFMAGINKVRHAAARIDCANKLHSLAIAAHNYADAIGYIPQAGMVESNPAPEKRLSWLVAIYPFVEASPLYRQIDIAKGWSADENRFAGHEMIFFYHCPAFIEGTPDSPFIPSYYIGVSGIGSDAVELPLEDPRAGFFGFDRKIPTKNLSERLTTSRLLMVLETCQPKLAWTASGYPTVRGVDPDVSTAFGLDRPFGSYHPEGVNALFADGSVITFNNSMDPKVLASLSTIARSKNAEAPSGE